MNKCKSILLTGAITRVSQKFCNKRRSSAALDTFAEVVKMMRCWTCLIFSEFVTTVWSMLLESMVLGLLDLAWELKFLKSEKNVLNHLVTVMQTTGPSPFAQHVFGCFYGIIA